MTETAQEQSDELDQTTDIVDPLDQMMNNPNSGTDNLASYEDERAALLRGEIPEGYEQGQDPAATDEETTDEEDGHDPETGEDEEYADEDEESATDEEPAELPAQRGSMRPRLHREEDIAIAQMAKALDIPLLDAADKYRQLKAGTEAQAGEPDDSPPPRTYAQARAELDARIQAHAEAIEAVDFDEQKRLFLEIEALRDEIPDLKETERRSQAQAAARETEILESAQAASSAKVFQFYPEFNDPESPIYKEFAKISARAVKLGDPLHEDPDMPWIIATRAAKATGTLMTDPESRPRQKAGPRQQVSPFQPAGGNARTSSADTAGAAKMIGEINSLEDYERLVGRR